MYSRIDVNFLLIYEFLFDRLRAIRQDLIVQRDESKLAIEIYKRILRFYILTDYKYFFFFKILSSLKLKALGFLIDYVQMQVTMNMLIYNI